MYCFDFDSKDNIFWIYIILLSKVAKPNINIWIIDIKYFYLSNQHAPD
jgi:hypothetical protein